MPQSGAIVTVIASLVPFINISRLTYLLTVDVGRCYYYLRLNDKPCLWVKGAFEDHRRRMFNSNIIEKIAEKLVSKLLLHLSMNLRRDV